MNKLGLFFVLGLMLAVFAGSANAVLTLSNPTIGSATQPRGAYDDATLTLTSTNDSGNVSVTNIQFAPVMAESATDRAYTATALNISFSNSTATVTANQTLDITVRGLIPTDFDAVNSKFEATPFKIGRITVAYGSGLTAFADVYMQAESALKFDKVKITVGESTETVKAGKTVDNLKPGDLLDIEVSAESKFDEDDCDDNDWDCDIEDVEVTIEIEGCDFDLDEDEDLSDLSPEDSDSVTFSNIVVDDEADGICDLTITVSGTDGESALHGETMTVNLKVERDTHEVIITKAQLTKPTVKCVDGTFERTDAKISVLNIGKRDEDEAAVEATIADLDLLVSKEELTLDSDDAATYTLGLQVPEGTKAGIYDVDIIAYAVLGAETDRQTLSLTVESCTAAVTTTATATTATTTGATATTGTAATATAPAARITSNTPFTETNTYMYVLGGVVVVLLISTIWIGVKLAALAK